MSQSILGSGSSLIVSGVLGAMVFVRHKHPLNEHLTLTQDVLQSFFHFIQTNFFFSRDFQRLFRPEIFHHPIPGLHTIYFIKQGNDRFVTNFQLIQRIINHMHMHIHLRIGCVHHMKNYIRIFCLFQCTPESLYQMMGELSDKSDRIRQKHFLTTVQLQIPGRRIQCGK